MILQQTPTEIWKASKTDRKAAKQHRDHRLNESQPKLFSTELLVKPKGTATKKVMMKETNSSVVKKTTGRGAKTAEQLIDIAREQRQIHVATPLKPT